MGVSRRSFLTGVLAAATSLPVASRLFTDGAELVQVTSHTASGRSGELSFGIPATPLTTDPSLAADTESYRLTRQVYDTLVGITPDTGAPTARLAVDWSVSDDQLVHTLTLRDDVVFHNGTPLTAQIVVENFRRWARIPELFDRAGADHVPVFPFEVVFGGYPTSSPTECLFDRAVAVSDTELEIHLTAPISGLVAALTDPAFAITAPDAWEQWDEDFIARYSDEQTSLSRVALAGTGPFMWDDSTDNAQVVTLTHGERSPHHGSTEGDRDQQVRTVHYRVVGTSHQRLYGLQTDQLDLFDAVSPTVLRPLVQTGTQVLQRDPMATVYLGFNHAHPVLNSLLVRQAVAHAVDRNRLVQDLFLAGTTVAQQFVPPALLAQPSDFRTYGHDMDEARRMLSASSYQGEPIEFWYPTGSDRPYLTEPERVYALISENLAACGFTLVPRPIDWDEGYLEKVRAPSTTRGFHLLGVTSPTRDPLRILGTYFHARSPEFGWSNPRVQDRLRAARSATDEQRRTRYLQDISRSVALDLPGLPLAFPITALATGPRVQYYPISPVLDEQLDDLQLTPGN